MRKRLPVEYLVAVGERSSRHSVKVKNAGSNPARHPNLKLQTEIILQTA